MSRVSWQDVARALQGKSIMLVGATGFIGNALIYWLRFLNAHYGADITIYGTTRRIPKSSQPTVSYLQIDVNNCIGDNIPQVDYVIHGANSVPGEQCNSYMFGRSIFQTTANVVDYINRFNIKAALLVSSGAAKVISPVCSKEMTPYIMYGLSKAGAEGLWIANAQENTATRFPIARGFAFSGCFLSVEYKFAFCEFVLSALRKQKIHVRGNPAAIRTYLDSQDMARYLLWILCHGGSGEIYDVGGAEQITIATVANTIARELDAVVDFALGYEEAPTGVSVSYIPDQRPVQSLGLFPDVTFEKSVLDTARFFQWIEDGNAMCDWAL